MFLFWSFWCCVSLSHSMMSRSRFVYFCYPRRPPFDSRYCVDNWFVISATLHVLASYVYAQGSPNPTNPGVVFSSWARNRRVLWSSVMVLFSEKFGFCVRVLRPLEEVRGECRVSIPGRENRSRSACGVAWVLFWGADAFCLSFSFSANEWQ